MRSGTSSLCPRCRVGLSPSGYRLMRCPRCGLEEDRDKIAVLNLLQRYRIDVPASSVHGEGLPMTTERDEKYEGGRMKSVAKVNAQTERFSISPQTWVL